MHTRIAVVNFLEPLKVHSQEEYDEVCRALGRQLLYGTEQEGTTIAQINPARDHSEHVTVYSRNLDYVPSPETPNWMAGEAITAAIEAARAEAGNVIVIGAVRGSGGKYSFHS